MPKTYKPHGVKTEFPTPKFRKVRDTDKSQKAIEFFIYWKRLDPKFNEFVQIHVYQFWPIMDFKIAEPDRTTVEREILNGPCPFEPADYREEFLKLYGSGEWRCTLNDIGADGAIIEVYFSAIDLERFPPKVDLRTVLPGNFRNRDYIRFLRLRNVPLPWELPEDLADKKKEQDEEMATTDALNTMADSNAKLAEKNMELAERVANGNKNEAQVTVEPTLEDRAGIAALDVMAHGTNAVMDMITKHSGTQYDPIQMIETVMKFAKPERPEGESDSVRMLTMFLSNMEKSNEKMLAMQRDQFDFMKSVTLGKNQDGSFGTTALAVAPKGFVDQLREYKEISELLGMGGRRNSPPPEPEGPPAKSWGVSLMENIGPIITGITTIGALAANMIYNFKLKPGETAQAPAQAMQAAAQAVPQATPMGPAQNQQPTPEQMAQAWAQVMEQQIKPALLAHLFGDGTNGYTFAEFVISDGTMAGPKERGKKFYMTLKEQLKPEGFMMLCRGNRDIWAQVSAIPEQFNTFMEEFFSYDEKENEPVIASAGAGA